MIRVANRRRVRATFPLVVSLLGLPPTRPLARAAARPALVRSRMRSRSNSASAPIRWKMSFPPGVVVSMLSVSEIKSTPRLLRRLRVSIRSLSERPNRSSFQTHELRNELVAELILELGRECHLELEGALSRTDRNSRVRAKRAGDERN